MVSIWEIILSIELMTAFLKLICTAGSKYNFTSFWLTTVVFSAFAKVSVIPKLDVIFSTFWSILDCKSALSFSGIIMANWYFPLKTASLADDSVSCSSFILVTTVKILLFCKLSKTVLDTFPLSLSTKRMGILASLTVLKVLSWIKVTVIMSTNGMINRMTTPPISLFKSRNSL